MQKRKRILLLSSTLILSASTISVVGFSTGSLLPSERNALGDENTLVISSANPSIGGVVKTAKGNDIWVKGDTSSGVTWNNGSSKIAIAKNGYLQTLTVIHGITKVKVELASGKLKLLHGFVQPRDLETPMYESGKVFTSNDEFIFSSNLPNRLRFYATEAAVINKITICYDCASSHPDSNEETLDSGLENSYIDAGSLATYATTSYVYGAENVSSGSSKRALKLEFDGSKNNYVSLSTQMNKDKGLSDKRPDFTNTVLTLKAKFSSNVTNKEIAVSAIGSGWADSKYITMNRTSMSLDGWYTYDFDFSDIAFDKVNDIIRINLKPLGINSANKSTAYVLFDEIDYHSHRVESKTKYENEDDGLENMSRDDNYGNVNVEFDCDVTRGRDSRNSIVCTPKDSLGWHSHWYTMFNPESMDDFSGRVINDVTKGTLSFDYKPVNCTNPTKVYLLALKDWSTNVTKELTGTSIGGGWYRVTYSLSDLGSDFTSLIRFALGLDVESSKTAIAKIYYDNIRIRESKQENQKLGLENLYIDAGMSIASDQSVDFDVVSSDASINSIKNVINGNNGTQAWQNSYATIFENKATAIRTMDQGILEAKFLFQGEFATKKLILRIFDSSWNGASFKDIVPTALGNGWYHVNIDMSTLSSWSGTKTVPSSFNFSSCPVRFGFGYQDLNDTNLSNKTIWIDDIFYHHTVSVPNVTIWQAYDTENIMQDDSTISERDITVSSPLYWSHARNAIDSTQLMIDADNYVSSFLFRPGTLHGSNGDVLSATSFEVLHAKYITVSESGEKTANGSMGTGNHPDALIPQDKYVEAGENFIASGKQQAIWINCSIPADQTPGTYKGFGTLTLDGTDYAIPMEVLVYNAKLDNKFDNRNCFLLWYDMIEYGEGSDRYSAQMRKAYFDFALNRGINPGNLHDWNGGTYEAFAETFATSIMPDDRISSYRLPLSNSSSQEEVTGYLSALATKNVEVWNAGNHVNFFDKILIYYVDEPSAPTYKDMEPEGWKVAKNLQTWIKNAKAEIDPTLTSYPEIKDGLDNVRNVIPYDCSWSSLSSSWFGNKLNDTYLDTPCPLFTHLQSSTDRTNYFNTFDRVWFYGCVNPQMPYPSYHTDTPLLGQRMIKWMQYDYGFEGEIYFCLNYYKYQGATSTTDRDPWTQPLTSTGKMPGDGMLMYPGKKYGVFGPITTMRLETLRNANQDYELFAEFDKHIAEYNENTGSSISSCKDLILSECASMFTNMQLNTRSHKSSTGYKSASFESFREYLLGQFEYCFK